MLRTRIAASLIVAAVVATAGGIAVAAAGSDDDGPTWSSTTTTVAPTPSPGLADGVHTGTIVAAYVAPDELVFEPAELLVGQAAVDAAAADGAEANDFYVRRSPDDRRTIPVASDVVVTAVACDAGCVEGAPSDYGTLTLEATGNGLYEVTVDDGVVVAIDARYLP